MVFSSVMLGSLAQLTEELLSSLETHFFVFGISGFLGFPVFPGIVSEITESLSKD